jgi:hypothetical protein
LRILLVLIIKLNFQWFVSLGVAVKKQVLVLTLKPEKQAIKSG